MKRLPNRHDKCHHCKTVITENDYAYLLALTKMKRQKVDNIENFRSFHTWCWEEVAGEDYML